MVRSSLNGALAEVLFTVMIKACAKRQEAERALNLLDDLRTCGLYPTDVTYTELIHACATSECAQRTRCSEATVHVYSLVTICTYVQLKSKVADWVIFRSDLDKYRAWPELGARLVVGALSATQKQRVSTILPHWSASD